MKRIVSICLALTLMAGLLSGCGTEPPIDNTTTPPPTVEQNEADNQPASPTTKEPEQTETPSPSTEPEYTTEPPTTEPAHEHKYSPTETVQPTCTEDGYTVYVCECGDSYNGDQVAKLDHSYEKTDTVEPTKETEGYTIYVCKVCFESKRDDYVPVVTEELSDVQRNSINMLNYLAVFLTDINASTNSRVFLDHAYSELINNTNPSSLDNNTLLEYESILDSLKQHLTIARKRERLQYIYDQNRASALRSVMPSPLSLLNVVNSDNKLKSLVSLLYLAADSANSYSSYTSEIDIQYLQDRWALDDAEEEVVYNSRSTMFTYMVRVVDEYDIPDNLTLTENRVNAFVEYKNKTNVVQRIEFLESNKEIYCALGDYWLTLADSYYANGNYQACLDAMEEYRKLDIKIFRTDYKLANSIPYAIVAANNTMSRDEYVAFAEEYLDLLVRNTDLAGSSNSKDSYSDVWALRYFAAQTYTQLYAYTKDIKYLDTAYDLTKDNVNMLVSKQEQLNSTYLAEIEKEPVPDNATKEQKKEIENLNKQLEEAREKELPPVYEPLRLNCDLLFALADELNISKTEKQWIDGMLHENGARLFLDAALDNLYRFDSAGYEVQKEEINIELTKGTIVIPAQFISNQSVIRLDINGTLISDWTIKKVDRNKSNQVSNFIATFTSEDGKDYEYEDGMVVDVYVYPTANAEQPTLSFKFVVEQKNVWFATINTKFVRVQ